MIPPLFDKVFYGMNTKYCMSRGGELKTAMQDRKTWKAIIVV